MARKRLKAVSVEGPAGVQVRVLFYEDGFLRFRISDAGPMAIEEAYLQGKGKNVILGIGPANRPD